MEGLNTIQGRLQVLSEKLENSYFEINDRVNEEITNELIEAVHEVDDEKVKKLVVTLSKYGQELRISQKVAYTHINRTRDLLDEILNK